MNARTNNIFAALALCAAFSANASALRDPTQPPMAPSAASTTAAIAPLRVEAIFRHGSQFTAIVDGKLVRAGDRVGAAVIQEITSDAVRYTRGGRSEITRLKSSTLNVRRPSAPVEEET